eukprot:scaffold115162_cov36-Tisochrysis_lutea.AAC.3
MGDSSRRCAGGARKQECRSAGRIECTCTRAQVGRAMSHAHARRSSELPRRCGYGCGCGHLC